MDWTIRNSGQKCDVSGVAFKPGDHVVSLLMKVPGQAELARFDFLESESENFSQEGTLLGRWTLSVRDDHETAEDKRDRRARKLGALEEFFLSLQSGGESAGEEDDDVREDRALLAYLAALTLERKKILRLKDRESTAQVLRYQHTQREEGYEVVVTRPSAERLRRVQEALTELL